MNRERFDSLSIEDQINHINEKLKSGKTLTNTCNKIKISRSTVAKRAEKGGYSFSKELNIYIQAYNKLTVSLQDTDEDTTQEESNQRNAVSTKKDICLQLDTKQQTDFDYLISNVEKIKSLIEAPNTESNKSFNSIDDEINKIYQFKQQDRTYKVKSLRIDETIVKDFEKTSKLLSARGINQQELLSYILQSYISFFNEISTDDNDTITKNA